MAGGPGLVEQVHRTLEAWKKHTRQVGRTLTVSTGLAPPPSEKPAILTSGGVTWCGHKLIAGEAHLWGRQVGTELFWLQLDSKVVLIDCFLGKQGSGESNLAHHLFPWPRMTSFCLCAASLSWVGWSTPATSGT